MVIKGHFSKGVIVLDEPVALGEGAEVSVLTDTRQPAQGVAQEPPTILELFSDLVGRAESLPPDASQNVDHYLYGLPKIE